MAKMKMWISSHKRSRYYSAIKWTRQEIADQYLPDEPELNKINYILAYGAANANHMRGNYDRAEHPTISSKALKG